MSAASANVVLASTSAIRRQVLQGAGVAFEAVSPGVDELAIKDSLLAEGVSPRDIADALAEAKAVKISRRRPGLVIGADQTLDLEGEGVQLFDRIEGDYFAILGLSLVPLLDVLRRHGAVAL